MFFLTPRYVKQGRNFIKDARKLLAYKRDLLDPKTISEFDAGIQRLESAVKGRNEREIEEAAKDLDKQCSAFVTPQNDQGWRENCEVFLVAIVVALGVRTYFLQPFTIPTGSMFPTLNGIIGARTEQPPPNVLVRMAQLAWLGRTWVNVVAETDDIITDVREVKTLPFTNLRIPPRLATRVELVGQRKSYIVDCPIDTFRGAGEREGLLRTLGPCKAGDVIARGYYDTGDHVFVDKMTYNFRKPRRGEVFVFNTQRIPTRENKGQGMTGPSQFYIKRLAGLPEDTLQIRPPELFINGNRAKSFGFERVMASQGDYHGYSNGSKAPMGFIVPMNLLTSPDSTVTLDSRSYFALGDNSYHSSDSRDWGPVPQENIMGHGVLVYWPFTRHFGLIH
jgi:signal peptidase I